MNDAIFPRSDRAALLVVDLQTKLLNTLPAGEGPALVQRALVLLALAREQGWTLGWTEQNPSKLGETDPTLAAELREAGASPLPKMAFSSLRDATFADEVLPTFPPHVVVIGIEAHICVLQTVADLQARGHQCFVPLDAVGSRDPRNLDNALALLERVGAVVTNTETLLFHTLQRAGTDAFRKLAPLVR